jgi:mono/diheme cytochrome c family protein
MKRLLPLLAILCLAGCHRGMEHQPSKRPFTPTPFFPDGQASRPDVPGTVSREAGVMSEAVRTGMTDGLLVAAIPIPVSDDLVARGRELFHIFCSVCHGEDGAGNGIVVLRGFPPPPSFHTERLRQAPAGHFFDVMTRGYGVMYPYADRVPITDRWAITAYIRALQLSQRGTSGGTP